jgi:transcriptional regulator with GAF, ATPase, and Fis domain/tetratricopeptide (TPR) repeat protein
MALVIFLDDVEAADQLTISVLEQLCLRAPEIPLTLIATKAAFCLKHKFSSLAAKHLGKDFQRLTLNGLSDQDSFQLLSYFQPRLEEQNVIIRISEGRPVLIREYALQGVSNVQMSIYLEQMFKLSLQLLPVTALKLAQEISIFAESIALSTIKSLSSLSKDAFEATAQQLMLVGLIFIRDSSMSFRHKEFRSRIYGRMPKTKRVGLHKSAYAFVRRELPDKALWAEQAFLGEIWEDAAQLYIQIADELHRKSNSRLAAECYTRAQTALRAAGKELTDDSFRNLALCYIRLEKHARAAQIYRQLLSEQEKVSNDAGILASLYNELARINHKGRLSERIRLCCRAIEVAPPNWETLFWPYVVLSQLLVQSGELTNAQKMLDHAVKHVAPHTDRENIDLINIAQAYLWMPSGGFQQALELLQSTLGTTPLRKCIAANNQALCWEHLGDLEKAIDLQLRSQKIAASIGSATGLLFSAINLGTFQRMLGDFAEADKLLTQALHQVAQIRSGDKVFRPHAAAALQVELARLHLEVGRYQEAVEDLKVIKRHENRALEGANVLLVKCELNISLGNANAIRRATPAFNKWEIFRTEFFSNERTLLESFLSDVDLALTKGRLENAIRLSRKLGTKYQLCKLLYRLAQILLQLDCPSAARECATEAFHLGETQSYRALAARSRLILALTCDNSDQRHVELMDTFHAAVEMGMPELVAESTFHIGVLEYRLGRDSVAEEYLLKSVSKTTELVQRVPFALRAKYLAAEWRPDAAKALQGCQDRIQSRQLVRGQIPVQEGAVNSFRALYRLALLSVGDKSLDQLLPPLVEAVSTTIRRPLVLLIQTPSTCFSHSARIKVTDDLETRIRLYAEKGPTKIYFGQPQQNDRTDALAWVPFRTQSHTGGLYIAADHRSGPLTEREIEFLIIFGRLAKELLHQAENTVAPEPSRPESRVFHGLVGASKAMKGIYSQIETAAGNTATVLIEGESGTGKELVARAIHAAGPRAKEPFVPVDCGAIPEGLIEAELFGAKKGSYTGAVMDRAGLFETAHKGTIFLDEISNTTPGLQAKLLRVIQEREVRRIGETKGRAIDVRVIVASNQNLDVLANDGRFRKDLLYRLKVLYVKLPPLRDHRDDIPMLAHEFLQKLNTSNKAKKYFGPGITDHLSLQMFPGNVRELQNAIERAFFSAKGLMITEVPLETHSEALTTLAEVQVWFKDITEGRKDFWGAVHNRYKRRDISREKVLALVDFGLRSTRGSYKAMASSLRLKDREYRRFMDFLRRNNCLLDFRPYRKSDAPERDD